MSEEPDDEKIYLTEKEVCEILSLPSQTLLKLNIVGVLNPHYRRRTRLYDPEEVRAFIIKATTSRKTKTQPIAEMQTIGEDHE